jgi:hypothetical protein
MARCQSPDIQKWNDCNMTEIINSIINDKAFEYGSYAVGGIAGVWAAIKKLRKKKVVNDCEDCGLCRHKLFQIMDSFLLNIEHPSWKCVNDYKTEIAKDTIRIKFQVGKKRIKDWVCKNKNVQDSNTLCDDFRNMIVDMINEYENAWVCIGINPVIINKLSSYHNHNARYAIKLGQSELLRDYNSTKDSLHHLLDSLISPYSMFISDIRNVMDSFNGELKDDKYKGIVNDGKYIELEISRLTISFSE